MRTNWNELVHIPAFMTLLLQAGTNVEMLHGALENIVSTFQFS